MKIENEKCRDCMCKDCSENCVFVNTGKCSGCDECGMGDATSPCLITGL